MDALFGNKPSTTPTEGEKNHPKPSNSELLASAKVVAEAAKSGFGNQSDKTKVAGAAEDLLNAAEDYGKLGEKGYGKYVDKAEEYLHQYSSTTGHPPTAATEAAPASAPAPAPEKPAESGGVGDVMKMAGNFFK